MDTITVTTPGGDQYVFCDHNDGHLDLFRFFMAYRSGYGAEDVIEQARDRCLAFSNSELWGHKLSRA